MKTTKLVISLTAVALFILISSTASGQGTFQNLDFEQANPVMTNVSPFYPSSVTAASALPSWTVTIGGVPQTVITENNPLTGSPWVMLVGPGYHFGFSPIDGNYSVLLQGTFSAASISQTAIIPASAQSLLFEAQPPASLSTVVPLDLLVGAQDIPFTAIGTGPNYTLYGADISAWAGQSESLTFSAPDDSGNWEVDDISFSPEAVPEPGTLSLLIMGGLTLAARRWRAKGT